MANMVETKQNNMSVILASNGIKSLITNMNLTPAQIQKASSSALQLSSNDKLKNCNNFSIAKYCFETARYNFTRDDAIYPVPYGENIQAQMGYKGYQELAYRSGKYSLIDASIVRDCDSVKIDEDTGEVVVKFNPDFSKRDKAKAIGYYAFAKNSKNEVVAKIFMSKAEMEKHGHKYSKTYNSIWGDETFGFDKMARKTVIKQLCSRLDQTPELQSAIELDQKVFNHGLADGEYLDNPNKNGAINATTVSNSLNILDAEKSEEDVEQKNV